MPNGKDLSNLELDQRRVANNQCIEKIVPDSSCLRAAACFEISGRKRSRQRYSRVCNFLHKNTCNFRRMHNPRSVDRTEQKVIAGWCKTGTETGKFFGGAQR